MADYPLKKFFVASRKTFVGSDHPRVFVTSIGREYEIVHYKLRSTERDLIRITRNAIEEAFVDEPTRARLLAKVDSLTPPATGKKLDQRGPRQ